MRQVRGLERGELGATDFSSCHRYNLFQSCLVNSTLFSEIPWVLDLPTAFIYFFLPLPTNHKMFASLDARF